MSLITVKIAGNGGIFDEKPALTSKDIFDVSSAIMLNRIRTRFRDAVDPDGTPWKESGAAKKRASKGIGTKTLFDTGKLFHSIQAAQNKTGYGIFTDVEYGKYHQYGTKKAPKREFLGFNQEDAKILKSLAIRAIEARYKQ